MNGDLVQAWLEVFERQKSMGEGAAAQVSDDALWRPAITGTNSIGQIMRHMGLQMKSRWTEFLTSDGDKPWRDREAEFQDPPITRDQLVGVWDEGWGLLFDAVGGLSVDDLKRTVTIRGEAHSVARAVVRQIDHSAYHVGQIVLNARHHAGENWEWLTIAPGKTDEFNATMRERFGGAS